MPKVGKGQGSGMARLADVKLNKWDSGKKSSGKSGKGGKKGGKKGCK